MTRFPSKAARLPYRADGAGREALPRLPRRTHEGQGPARAAAAGAPDRTAREPREPKIRRPRRRWSWKRRIGIGLIVFLVARDRLGRSPGYLSFRSGVDEGERAPRPVGAAGRSRTRTGCCSRTRRRCCCSATDHENTDQRVGLNHSDSIMLLRTDPSRHRLVYLSIPRDLRVPIPGHGEDRINTAYPLGGARAHDPDDRGPHRDSRSTT